MSVFIFDTVVDAAGRAQFCGIYSGGRFEFPGATFDAQVNSALDFVNTLDAGEGDAIQWIDANLTQLAGNPNWADDAFAEFFGDATEIIVDGTVIVDLQALIDSGSLAEDAASIGDVISNTEGVAFQDVLADALDALIAV